MGTIDSMARGARRDTGKSAAARSAAVGRDALNLPETNEDMRAGVSRCLTAIR
jgi:hypothetical protein